MAFQTTAIYANRIRDKRTLESKIHLSEQGNNDIEFYSLNDILLFKGYERIVYGDHGPYIECDISRLKCELKSKFGNIIDYNTLPLDCKYYYYWLYPIGAEDIKIYLQIKPVIDIPNAPKRDDGLPSQFNRKKGYADYKRGYFYFNPYSVIIKGI